MGSSGLVLWGIALVGIAWHCLTTAVARPVRFPAALLVLLWANGIGACLVYSSGTSKPVLMLAAGAACMLLAGSACGQIPLVLMTGLIAYYSGGQGGASGWAETLAAWLHVSVVQAESIVHYARKTVHFCFYGLLGLLAWRAHRKLDQTSIVHALGFVACFAAFDEVRQSSLPNRSGSAWDVLIDLAGAAAFIGVGMRSARRARQTAPDASE